MDRFWVIFLSLAVIVPLSAAGYFYYLDNPFDGKPTLLDEGSYVWRPSPESQVPSTDTEYSRAIKSALQAQVFLKQGDYDLLETTISTARRQDYTPWYQGSWIAFYNDNLRDDTDTVTDRDIARARQWLDETPDSIYALSYLGFLYSEQAWSARGSKYRQETPEKNFVEMRKYFKLAKAEYEKALSIEPQNTYLSRQLLQIAWANCHREDLKSIFRSAIRHTQDYYYLHKTYLDALQQIWCGDTDRMFAFARKYGGSNNSHPTLLRLPGHAHENLADKIARQKSILDPLYQYLNPQTNLYQIKYYRYFHDADVWEEYSGSYETLLDVFPDYSDALYQYARTAHKSGRKQTALKYFEKALNADAAFLGADRTYYVATIFHYANHKTQAGRYFELYLNLLDDGEGDLEKVAYSAEYVGWRYAIRQEYETSFPYYKKAAELSPRSAHAISNYCNALFKIHRYEDAVKFCESAIKIDPNYAWSYNILAQIYSRTGEPLKSSEYRDQYKVLSQ